MNDGLDSQLDSAEEVPRETGRWRSLRATAWLLLLGACVQQPPSPPEPEVDALRQRLQVLERRVEMLEGRNLTPPSPPLRSRDEIDRTIQSLESKRSELLERYTTLHPEVREIDRSLQLLQRQLEAMNQGSKSAK